ncbi:MAG: hypothetical protein A2795_15285 [Caulobacterales bacterium RIFCSPHIGHO2_01_FULL_67_30]|nr:MAG: hypothetical protein A2795_15285 [Caulobacterales bacterium RIFCSPHIGHO2_01_FULL_67_30]OGN48121.1 MAG: hypothetical protein A3E24_00485 [Caulobacterales bacterium RIFCSPHIGHO2_12_FULL_68_13]
MEAQPGGKARPVLLCFDQAFAACDQVPDWFDERELTDILLIEASGGIHRYRLVSSVELADRRGDPRAPMIEATHGAA